MGELEEKIADHCGGDPNEYKVEKINISDLDSYEDEGMDKQKDNLPINFNDIELDEVEEI
jgi:hypothetical protein